MKSLSLGSEIHGILLINKPKDLTSNAVLQRVKRLLGVKKAGHTGSLDPLATGMLPICLNQATKFSNYLLTADKKYTVIAKLGVKTSTGDTEGDVISERVVPSFKEQDLLKVFDSFIGDIQQIPSMFSALKHKGQPLYKLARQGIEVERKPRDIKIYSIKLLHFQDNHMTMEVHCSKGTYIRNLVEDIGESLGCGAHVISLHRNNVGDFQDNDMISLSELERLVSTFDQEKILTSIVSLYHLFKGLPEIFLSKEQEQALRHGQVITLENALKEGMVVLMNQDKYFIGLGDVLANQQLKSRRHIIFR